MSRYAAKLRELLLYRGDNGERYTYGEVGNLIGISKTTVREWAIANLREEAQSRAKQIGKIAGLAPRIIHLRVRQHYSLSRIADEVGIALSSVQTALRVYTTKEEYNAHRMLCKTGVEASKGHTPMAISADSAKAFSAAQRDEFSRDWLRRAL